MPPAQMTTVGTTTGTHRLQVGQTAQDVANTYYGGSTAALIAANPQINQGGPGLVTSPGMTLRIPGASQEGPPVPGGPAGNGVGGGSFSQPPAISTRVRRGNATSDYAVPGGQAMTGKMNRKQRKANENQKASGR